MKNFAQITLSAKAVVVFKNVLNDNCISSLLRLLGCDGSERDEFVSLYSDFVSALYEKSDDLCEYINLILQNDENMYVKESACGNVSPLMEKAVEYELDLFEKLSKITCDDVKSICDIDIPLPQWTNSALSVKDEYVKKISSIKTTGYGIYATHHMFLYKDEKIIPVKFPDPQRLSQMSGYELERQKVIDNTMALIQGKPCNNVLLYGDAGSGKSSTIKAIVNEYWNMGLRLIEIKKNQLYSLPDVIEQLADNPLKFIIFIDDLSFSTNDNDFGALKAILEGGVSGKTENIAIYATSNRRNLVKENFNDRNGDDIHLQDTIQEVMSLSARFGLKITFSKPNKDLYLSIVENLAMQYNICMDKNELDLSAEAFAIRNGGRSPRTAKQFIEYLASKSE
ncbi:MAG: ATP-binding protein [Clostridia bacterium]|nr:ATP-binding protein [Clostridia bacterium]